MESPVDELKQNRVDRKASEFTEALDGFKNLMAGMSTKMKTMIGGFDQMERDQISLMERQIEQEKRIQKLERAAGFRTPLFWRLLGRKSHLDYPIEKLPGEKDDSTTSNTNH